jgi:hypothetical protein
MNRPKRQLICNASCKHQLHSRHAVFSDVWCGTPTASHQGRFLGSREIGVL